MIATCNTCREFSVPWDPIGAALMKQHLLDCKDGRGRNDVGPLTDANSSGPSAGSAPKGGTERSEVS